MATTFFRKDGWVKTVLGPAVPGAQVYVCAPQPANVSALPPSPLANIFSDINGLVPITQPIITDGFGHYDYYVAAGLYTEVIGAAGIVQQVYPDQYFGLGNAGPGNPYVAGANITIIGNVISAVIPPQVTIDLQTNSVDNTSQNKLNLKNGTNISVSSDGVGGVTITNTQTQLDPTTTIRFVVPKWATADTYLDSPQGWCSPTDGGIGSPTFSVVAPTVSVPSYAKLTTPASTTDNAFFLCTSKQLRLDLVSKAQLNVAYFSAASVRNWVLTMTDITTAGSGNLEFDNPTGNMVGFRYSTAAGDTHWKAYTATSNVAFTVADTGVSLDTTGALHLFETRTAQGVPGTILFFIDGVQVASISTNVPAATTTMIYCAYVEALTNSARSIGSNLQSFVFFQ